LQQELKAILCCGNLISVMLQSEQLRISAYTEYPRIHMVHYAMLLDNGSNFTINETLWHRVVIDNNGAR